MSITQRVGPGLGSLQRRTLREEQQPFAIRLLSTGHGFEIRGRIIKVVVLSAGSLGGLPPVLAPNRGLLDAGDAVPVTALERFRRFAGSHGLGLWPLAGDPSEMLETPPSRARERADPESGSRRGS
jgi:hypothetical protein